MQDATNALTEDTDLLAPALTMGPVSLNVHDLPAMTRFYAESAGLETIADTGESVTLGSGDQPLVVLHRTPDLRPAAQGSAGLYHLALVYPSQGDLALAVQRGLRRTPHLFHGSADHLVSEAFYFTDPEGNGVELYRDRPWEAWEWQNGTVRMDSLYIDPAAFIRQHVRSATGGRAAMGHVHLRVGDTEEARAFYADTVGFTVTAEMPSALFVSVGGYHHHLGMNAWESRDAGKRAPSLGLRQYSIVLPSADAIGSLRARLEAASVRAEEEIGGIAFQDPWGNRISVTV